MVRFLRYFIVSTLCLYTSISIVKATPDSLYNKEVEQIKSENQELKKNIQALKETVIKIEAEEKKIEQINKEKFEMLYYLLGIYGIILLAIAGFGVWKSDVTARNTARDEFHKNFKDQEIEITQLLKDARKKIEEINTKAEALKDFDEKQIDISALEKTIAAIKRFKNPEK